MQKYHKSMSGLAVGFTLTLAACGGDLVGVNSGDELSDTEIQAIFNAFSGALDGVDASASRVAPQDGIQMADIDVNQSVNISTGCNLGGEISLSGSVEGTVDDETFASNLEMGIGIQFDACIIASEENTVSVDGSQVGGFDFTTNDGRIGSCAIDIDFSASLSDGTSAQSSVTGTVCGRSASQFEAYTGT
jgi:hypothetical protein